MPKPEEIDAIVGDKPAVVNGENGDTAKPSEQTPVVEVPTTPEEYRKIAESYHNIRQLESRRDQEIRELRDKVKKYENPDPKPNTPKPDTTSFSDDEDVEELEALKHKLGKLGFVPKSEVKEEVEKELRLQDQVLKLRTEVQKAIERYPFVKEAELLSFIGEKGGVLTVDEAMQLKYHKELAAFEASGEHAQVPETDSDGRTIMVSAVQKENKDTPIKRGTGRFGRDTGLSDWISARLTQAIDGTD